MYLKYTKTRVVGYNIQVMLTSSLTPTVITGSRTLAPGLVDYVLTQWTEPMRENIWKHPSSIMATPKGSFTRASKPNQHPRTEYHWRLQLTSHQEHIMT